MATPTTLPATFVAGDVLTAAQMNNLRGAFRVLQVVQGTLGTIATNNSSTQADTGLSVSITPQATTNKVLVTVSIQWQKSGANSGNGLNLYLVRNSTTITQYGLIGYTGTALQNIGSACITFLDSPSTTSATTYKLQFSNNFNGGSIYVSSDGSTSTIVAQEISA
jgi:hypothetical protein